MLPLPFLLLLWAAVLSKSGGRCRAFSLGPVSLAGRRTAGRPAAATPAPMAAGSDGDDGAATKVVIVGGGIAGLSTAHYLATDPGNKFAGQKFDITVLDREPPARDRSQTYSSSLVNFGNLGPQFGWFKKGPLFKALTESVKNYEEWVNSVENGAKTASDDIKKKYLPTGEGEKPWEVGYMEGSKLLAPLIKDDSEKDWVAPEGYESFGEPTTLIKGAVLQDEIQDASLNREIEKAFLTKKYARVDARRLMMSLRTACENSGVNMLLDSDYGVESLILDSGGEGEVQECQGVTCTGGDEYRGKVVVANGAGLNALLKDVDETPEKPVKSVVLSVIVYRDDEKIAKGPMFRKNAFSSPTLDGKVLVAGRVLVPPSDDWQIENINAIKKDLSSFNSKLAELPVERELELVRSETGDTEPILGGITSCTNMYFAGAFSFYGMALAPKSAQVVGDVIAGVVMSDDDEKLLEECSLTRDNIDGDDGANKKVPF